MTSLNGCGACLPRGTREAAKVSVGKVPRAIFLKCSICPSQLVSGFHPGKIWATILRSRELGRRREFRLGKPRQRIGEHGPILCSDLRRVSKLVTETEESIFDTGFRVTSRLDESNEPHRCRAAVALSSYARLPRVSPSNAAIPLRITGSWFGNSATSDNRPPSAST